MSIARWDPFIELNRMNRLFRDMWRDREEGQEGSLASSTFVPPVDISEDENHLTVELEIPGMKEQDLHVRVDGNVLTVDGERKLEREEKGKDFRRIERQYGSFQRSIALPNSVDPNSANASYDNGVLRIQFARRAEAKPREIKVGQGQSQMKSATSEKTKAA
ncbi:MAG: Hsp20/alpha crystallin family protein [Terriglobales bacterium]